jgi:multidrug resistance efflux pump
VAAEIESNAPPEGVPSAVNARGHVESAKKAQIRSEVRGTTSVLEIVPEGKRVETGDILVRLDPSEMEEEKRRQQVECEVSRAAVMQVERAHESAQVAKAEYLEGLYPLELTTIEYEAFLAEEGLRRAEREVQRVEQLPDGEPTKKDRLHNAEFAVAKAKRELDLAQARRKLLEKYTKEKMLRELQSEIDGTKAELVSEKTSHQVAPDNLTRIEQQLEKCVITAPFAGQVAYFRPPGPRDHRSPSIQESVVVRGGQTLLELFDTSQFIFIARIDETKASQVTEGLPATIRLDAFVDREFSGRVEKVQTVTVDPRARRVVRYVDFTISLEKPHPRLLPGLTGDVSIGLAGKDMP